MLAFSGIVTHAASAPKAVIVCCNRSGQTIDGINNCMPSGFSGKGCNIFGNNCALAYSCSTTVSKDEKGKIATCMQNRYNDKMAWCEYAKESYEDGSYYYKDCQHTRHNIRRINC